MIATVLVRKSTFSVDLPPRSRLYCLAPIGVGTPMVECLTSYINRLAWLYRISPRILVAEEIMPHLSGSYYFQPSPWGISNYSRQAAMARLGREDDRRNSHSECCLRSHFMGENFDKSCCVS